MSEKVQPLLTDLRSYESEDGDVLALGEPYTDELLTPDAAIKLETADEMASLVDSSTALSDNFHVAHRMIEDALANRHKYGMPKVALEIDGQTKLIPLAVFFGGNKLHSMVTNDEFNFLLEQYSDEIEPKEKTLAVKVVQDISAVAMRPVVHLGDRRGAKTETVPRIVWDVRKLAANDDTGRDED